MVGVTGSIPVAPTIPMACKIRPFKVLPPPPKSSQTALAQLCHSEVQHGDRPQARRQVAGSNSQARLSPEG